MYTSENNWYSWQYGDDELFGRQSPIVKKFNTHLGSFSGNIENFGDELKKAAASTIDHYSGLKPCVLFSGGQDSELVLRSYIDIGIIPDVFIARYEKDINIADVSYAIAICMSFDIKYNLIEINLKNFFENEAEEISEKAQVDFPRALPQLLLLKKIENGFPILCTGDPTWYRTHSNYSVSGTWIHTCNEYDIGWSKYARFLNRPAIGEWFKWTPGIIISHSRLAWFRKLINDEYYGKLGVKSTKIIGYREVYPDLIFRKKLTGFEEPSIDPLIDEFEDFLEKKYNGLPYRNVVKRTLTDIENEILGK